MTGLEPGAMPVSDPDFKVRRDYFGESAPEKFMLDDGVSWVLLKKLREGERRKLQNASNKDITVQKGTGDAKLRLAPGDERYALLSMAIVGWSLYRGNEEILFNQRELEIFLDKAPPEVIDDIEEEVRKRNPWLTADMRVEDIDKEIERLKELRVTVEEAEKGKGTS